MRVLGVDVGATCGLVMLHFDGMSATWIGDESTRDPFASPLLFNGLQDLVVVEGIGNIYARDRFNVGMATALKNAARLAGRFEQWARDREIDFEETTAREARSRMCGRPNAKDRDVADVVRARVAHLPTRTSAHVRDAALAAMYVVMTRRLRGAA